MSQRKIRRLAIALASALVALAILASGAGADAPGATAAFTVDASNGYKILAYAFSRRVDGKGDVILFVGGGRGGASYFAPANVTPTAIHADLGSLGHIDLQFRPSGVVKQERSSCDKRSVPFDAGTYRGTFEFRGEEQFTQAEATSVHSLIRPILNLVCGGVSQGETSGYGVRGARLRLFRHDRGRRIALQFNKNRRDARVRFEASIKERKGRIAITRSVGGRAIPGSAFSFTDDLQTATLSPPAPFTGKATFHRSATPANRWTGNLTVDFPGEANVALTGSKVRATLVHAEFSEERPNRDS